MILILSKFRLLRKLFYIINIVGFINMFITFSCIYIDQLIAVYSVIDNANLYIDFKKLNFNLYLLGIFDF